MGTVTAKIFLPSSVSLSTNGELVFMAVTTSLSHFSPISFGSLDAIVTQPVLLGGVADSSSPPISGCAASVSSTTFCANILTDTLLLFRADSDNMQSKVPQVRETRGFQLRFKQNA